MPGVCVQFVLGVYSHQGTVRRFLKGAAVSSSQQMQVCRFCAPEQD